MKDDLLYIVHLIKAMRQIMVYVDGQTQSSFMGTQMLQDAVIRQLEIVGESTKRVYPSTKSHAEHIPWKDMAGMRDKLIHDYSGTDLFKVWTIATERVPAVLPLIEQLFEELKADRTQ